jgi:nitrogen regulatory protein PII
VISVAKVHIEAIVLPERMENIMESLSKWHMDRCIVSSVKGIGLSHVSPVYRKQSGGFRLVSKVRLDIIVDEPSAEPVIQTILTAARTGNLGDGKIFISQWGDGYDDEITISR